MADYKDYLVRYDIVVDISKAEAGLKAVGSIAEQFAPKVQELAKAIQTVSSSVSLLRSNSSIKFAPVIDVDTFKYQLGKLTVLVKEAAIEMQAAFREAFSVNAAASEAMRKGMAKMATVPTKSLDDLQGRLVALNKEYDKLMGTPARGKGRKKDGSIQMAKNALAAMKPGTAEHANMEQRLKDYESQAKSLKSLIAQTKTAIKEYNKTEKAGAKAVAGAGAAAPKATVTKSAAATPPLSNVSAQAINAWAKFFGNSKSKTLTLNVRGKVIGIDAGGKTFGLQIIGMIKELRSQVKEAIPINVKASPAQVKEALRNIAAPTLKVNVQLNAAGVQERLNAIISGQKGKTTSKGKKGVKGGKGAKGTAAGATSMMVDVIANVVGATPATELLVPVTGEIVKAIPKLAAEAVVPVVGEVTKVVNQKGKATPLPVSIKANNEQLKKLTTGSKVPPIELVLDTTAALAKLDEFLAKIKGSSPQNIALTASGAQSKTEEKTSTTPVAPIPPAKGGVSKSKSPVLTVAEKRRKLQKSFAQIASDETKRDTQRAKAEKARIRAGQIAADKQGFEEWSKSLDDKKKAQQAAAEQRRKFSVQRSIAAHQQKAAQLRSQFINSIGTMAKTDVQRNLILKNRKFFKAALQTSGIKLSPKMSPENKLRYLQEVSRHMNKAGVSVPIQMVNEMQNLQKRIDYMNSGGGYYGGLGRHKPMNFFDKTRKWAFPFTGPTSFGVRTPMAVDMAKGMGVMFAIGGAMSAIGSSFGQAMEYQNTMRTTKAILQNGTSTYSEKGFHNMEKIVRNVGVRTKFSAPEVANAARFLAMAGYDIPAINEAIRPIADLALIGDTDLGETADKMTNIMTTFGIPAEKMRQAANIMTTTATRSNTDLMMLAESAKYGGGVANMYGKDDPNLFADTMAIFGIMGNAGIQASSAGTALRMMYQNIFNPNKKQSAILASLEKYGIRTMEGEGKNKKYRAMSAILLDMANKIPKEEMAEIISKLFRITAQPGANAALMAAANNNARELVKAAEEDGSNAEEAAKGMDKFADFIQEKGVGKLLELMMANRQSANSNVSETIALEKQNTIQGLWAQVTSMFTEGIVKAFEKKQGYLSNMLANLRDYMAKPETVRMLQNLLDLVIGIAKVLGTVAGIWANIYSMAPGLIKFWVTTQMLFSQFGTLLSPFVALTGVIQRFGSVLSSVAGMGSMSVGSRAATAGAASVASSRAAASMGANAALMAPLIIGKTTKGKDVVIRGAIAARARKDIASANMLAAVALAGASPIRPGYMGGPAVPYGTPWIIGRDKSGRLEWRTKRYENLTNRRYLEIQSRARRIYGPWGRFKGGFNAGRTLLNGVNLATMAASAGRVFSGLMGSIGKAIGFLASPISIVTAGVGVFAYGLYKLKQRLDGLTPEQQKTQEKVEAAGATAGKAWGDRAKSFNGMAADNSKPIEFSSGGNFDVINQYNKQQQDFKDMSAQLSAGLHNNASEQANDKAVADLRELVELHPIYKRALGEDYDQLIGQGLTNQLSQIVHSNPQRANSGMASSYYVSSLLPLAPTNNPTDKAVAIEKNMVKSFAMMEGGSSELAKNTIEQLAKLQEDYRNGTINTDKYIEQRIRIRNNISELVGGSRPSVENLSVEDYLNSPDRIGYAEYWQGFANIVNAELNMEAGSLSGQIEGFYTLKNNVDKYSEEWWKAISQAFYGRKAIYNALDENGKFQKRINMELSMLPNGKLDYSNLLQQVQSAGEGLNFNLRDFANLAAMFYSILAQYGFVKDTYEGRRKFVASQIGGQHLTKQDVLAYYKTYIHNPQKGWASDWVNVSDEQYWEFINGGQSRTLPNGKRWSPQQEINIIGHTIARDAAKGSLNSKPAVNPNQDSGDTGVKTPETPTQSAGAGENGQIAYASPYSTSVPQKPQIIINVENLANFDRTTIASSADERDLMESVENKITDAIHQLVAQAAYSSGYVIDVT